MNVPFARFPLSDVFPLMCRVSLELELFGVSWCPLFGCPSPLGTFVRGSPLGLDLATRYNNMEELDKSLFSEGGDRAGRIPPLPIITLITHNP